MKALTLSEEQLGAQLDLAENRTWDSLAHYKFMMFGYWAAIWVYLNHLSSAKRRNPWRGIVSMAKATVFHSAGK